MARHCSGSFLFYRPILGDLAGFLKWDEKDINRTPNVSQMADLQKLTFRRGCFWGKIKNF